MANTNLKIKAVLEGIDNLTGPLRRALTRTTAAIGRALDKVRGYAWSTTKALGRIGVAAAAAGAAGAAGLFALTSSHAEQADAISKLARQVDFSVESLQRFEHVAGLSGVSSEEFRAALKKLTMNMGMLKMKSGPMVELLKHTPAAFRKQLLGAKTNEEAFLLLVAAMRKIPDPTKRAAFAAQAFGEIGIKLTTIAETTAESFDELAASAQGVITKEEGAQAEAFGDSLSLLKGSVGALKTSIGSALVPVLTPLLTRLTEWVNRNRELISQRIQATVRAIGYALDRIDWDKVRDGAAWVVEKLQELVDWGRRVVARIREIVGDENLRAIGELALKFGAVALALSIALKPFRYFGGLIGPLIKKAVIPLVAWLGKMTFAAVRAGIAFMMTPVGWLTAAFAGLAIAIGVVAAKWRELTGESNQFTKASPQLIKRLQDDAKFKQRQVEAAFKGDKAARDLLNQAFEREFDKAFWEDADRRARQKKQDKILADRGLSGPAAGAAPASLGDMQSFLATLGGGDGPALPALPDGAPFRAPRGRGGDDAEDTTKKLGELNKLLRGGVQFGAPVLPPQEAPAAQATRVDGEIRVKIDGLPEGARVKQEQKPKGPVAINASVGRRRLAMGLP